MNRIGRKAACDDGVINGFVRVNGDEIEKRFVEPNFRGQGVGDAL